MEGIRGSPESPDVIMCIGVHHKRVFGVCRWGRSLLLCTCVDTLTVLTWSKEVVFAVLFDV